MYLEMTDDWFNKIGYSCTSIINSLLISNYDCYAVTSLSSMIKIDTPKKFKKHQFNMLAIPREKNTT